MNFPFNLTCFGIAGFLILVSAPGCKPRANSENNLRSVEKGETWQRDSYFGQSQGFTPDQREAWYWTGQGSQAVPYKYFLFLEQENSEELFRSAENMTRYGYIPEVPSAMNPDGLPVGFVKSKIKRDNSEWVGFSCAACHTGEISVGGKTMRIEGGASMSDHMLFRADLLKALEKTKDSKEKYARFAEKVLGNRPTQGASTKLNKEFSEYLKWFRELNESSREPADVPFGPGRLDAFSLEINQFVVDGLGIKENYHSPDAPVSYPQVWDSTDLDWVQWNGISKIPLERNIGEAIGVFGRITLTGGRDTLFDNNIDFEGLWTLEKTLQSMKGPSWPGELLGAIDKDKAVAGRKIFEENCYGCHNDVTDRTEKNSLGKDFIKIKMVPAAEIKTDPVFLQTLLGWTVKTGPLQGLVIGKNPDGSEIKLGAVEPAAKILKTSILGIEKRYFAQERPSQKRINELRNFVDEESPVPPNLNAYKARPLNGIWATPPFLHNGSVPSLYELLKPANERIEVFYLGSTEFDPEKVGYITEKTERNYFKFDTKTKSNSNSGHEYGTQLNPDEKSKLIEYLKSI